MNYYEVIPASNKYHGGTGLTYKTDRTLAAGQIVAIKIRAVDSLGFVAQAVPKPDFAVHPLAKIFDSLVLPSKSLKLFCWLQSYYPGPSGVLASLFVPSGLLAGSNEKPPRTRILLKENPGLPPLSHDQQEVLRAINGKLLGSFLIHGETGSGKTRIYIELARKALSQNGSVLILTPEISLTPQLVETFTSAFGDIVEVTHSHLTSVQRKKIWLDLQNTKKPRILIGPRSALFMPLGKIGLVVIDEFHDQAYKQDSSPYYQALRVGSKLAEIHGAKLVLGSATPAISEYFFAKQKQVPILRMISKPALDSNGIAGIDVHVADLSDPQEKTKYSLISTTLLAELKSCLARGEQAMVFLNKRGSARAVVCQSCGWQALCPRCDLAMVYHGDSHVLYCHTCGFSQKTPNSCPSCGSAEILFKSPGTKAVADYLKSLFPEAQIARFDKDNKKAERIEARHAEIHDGSIDILVGTQLLAKGHDLPKLGLVGILLAETGLIFPDYTSEETSYQIIHQLLGRVGRGHRPGVAVVQTFDPKNPTILAAISGKWGDFYESQLEARKAFGFPPFFHAMKVHAIRRSRAGAKKAAEKLADDIKKGHKNIVVTGPSPSFIEKRGDKWHWQLIVKAKRRALLLDVIKSLPKNIPADIDPNHLL